MDLLKSLRQIYSLNTLDTRFTTSSSTPQKSADDARVEQSKRASRDEASGRSSTDDTQPPKWNTLEFYVYYTIFIVVVPMMFKVVYDVSKPSDPNYPKYQHLLSNGWMFGRKVDNSDGQYASFRNNVPYLALVVILHPLLRNAYEYFYRTATYTQIRSSNSGLTQGLPASAAADVRFERRLTFDLIFAVVFIFALHGFSAFKVILILFLNFKLATQIPREYIPYATWIFNISILFANEIFQGYPLGRVATFFAPPNPPVGGKVDARWNWGQMVDSYGGLIPRWEVLFNITVLRLISFNLDYYWSLNHGNSSPLEKKQLDPAELSERDRVSISPPAYRFTFKNYFAYALYSPLYLTGPIITFNDYISQLRYPLPSITRARTTAYAIRFLIALLAMELMIHFLYPVAISKSNPNWNVYTPFQLSMLGYFSLHHIWLKLLLPWRFFRLWALIDGIDPPENMVRCMSDNYSMISFWRGWHRSYNRWLTRYIYIPLGGGKGSTLRVIANYLAAFTFVALWHDIQLRLLIWGWLVTLFVLPQVLAMLAFPARKWRDRPTAYRVLSGIGAVGNILMLMTANLVGFAVGLDGLKGLVSGIAGSWAGVVFIVAAVGALFVGVQVMFEIREEEKREGIRMKC